MAIHNDKKSISPSKAPVSKPTCASDEETSQVQEEHLDEALARLKQEVDVVTTHKLEREGGPDALGQRDTISVLHC